MGETNRTERGTLTGREGQRIQFSPYASWKFSLNSTATSSGNPGAWTGPRGSSGDLEAVALEVACRALIATHVKRGVDDSVGCRRPFLAALLPPRCSLLRRIKCGRMTHRVSRERGPLAAFSKSALGVSRKKGASS